MGSSATLGTTTNFSGTILASTSVTLNAGATVDGRILAQTGAVTLDSNTVTVPTCSTPSTTTPSTTTSLPSTATTSATPVTTPPVTTPPVTTPPVTTPPVTAPSSISSPTIVPVSAPATGKGGTAGPSKLQLVIVGLIALLGALGAGGYAIRSRRQSS